MKTKIYGIFGKRAAEITIRVGKATLPIEFTKGSLDSKNYRPATYTTDNETIQNIIENCSYFGTTIRLVKTIDNGPDSVVSSLNAEESTSAPEQLVYDEVTDIEGARRVLKQLGAKAIQLADEQKMKKYALSRNVVFPNFEF